MKDQEIKFVPGIMIVTVFIVLFLIAKFVISPIINEENKPVAETVTYTTVESDFIDK